MAAEYERELRKIFEGDIDVINKMGKTMPKEDVNRYKLLVKNPFYVLRGAGSIGVDLMPVRYDRCIPIEVKSKKKDTFYFGSTGHDYIQMKNYLEIIENTHIPLLYAFRHKNRKGEKWSMFRLNDTGVYLYVPKIPTTKSGNSYMPFEDGMPLSEFIKRFIMGW